MRRRSFLIGVVTVLAVGPEGALAQRRLEKMPRVGILSPADSDRLPIFEGFRVGLRDRGYVEGRDIVLEFRLTRGDYAALNSLVGELARVPVDVIVPVGFPATKAVHRAALTIPAVFVVADPVGSGFAASLARPGGNMTGLSIGVEGQFSGKWLELLKESAPQVSRVAYLWNPANHGNALSWEAAQRLAPRLGLTLESVELRDPKDIREALAAISREHAEGMIVDSDAVLGSVQAQILDFASTHRLPLVSVFKEWADAGALMSYGPNLPELWRYAATYVDKILKGAKPADLPVEEPTMYELVINLKAAKALGLSIPQSILLRADEVIE